MSSQSHSKSSQTYPKDIQKSFGVHEVQLDLSRLEAFLQDTKALLGPCTKGASSTLLGFIGVQKNMRVTRRIVLPLLTKVLYEFGCFEGILLKAKFALVLLFY